MSSRTFTAHEKERARSRFSHAVSVGRIVRQPCEVCGEPKTEGHHDDYSRPLDVRWLCRPHHHAHHHPPPPVWIADRIRAGRERVEDAERRLVEERRALWQTIADEHHAGCSLADIAREMNVSRQRVRMILDQLSRPS